MLFSLYNFIFFTKIDNNIQKVGNEIENKKSDAYGIIGLIGGAILGFIDSGFLGLIVLGIVYLLV